MANNDNILRGARDRARVGGSGFTTFLWENQIIAFARQVSIQSPTGVGPGTVPIHPLDRPYPVELVTPMAATMGGITLELYELYGANVWERLAGLGSGGSGPVDLVGIFRAVANATRPIRIVKMIKPPRLRGALLATSSGGSKANYYTEEYHNCVVSQVEDGETIEVGTMEVLKRMTVNYTHLTRGGRNNVLDTVNNTLGRDSTTTDFGAKDLNETGG